MFQKAANSLNIKDDIISTCQNYVFQLMPKKILGLFLMFYLLLLLFIIHFHSVLFFPVASFHCLLSFPILWMQISYRYRSLYSTYPSGFHSTSVGYHSISFGSRLSIILST